MELYLNGALSRFDDGIRISDLTHALGLAGQRFAVEVNRSIVPRSLHAEHLLLPGDRVEIIQAIGGG